MKKSTNYFNKNIICIGFSFFIKLIKYNNEFNNENPYII